MVQTRAQVRVNKPQNAIPSRSSKGRQEDIVDPVACWAREGRWPAYYAMPPTRINNQVSAPKKVLCRNQRLSSRSCTSQTGIPSDSRGRKHAPYNHAKYTKLLERLGSFMHDSKLGPAPGSRLLCSHLLQMEQPFPNNSHFSDSTFERFCQRAQHQNEASILRDVTPLLVPSAENLALHGMSELDCLAEGLDSVWDSCWPLTSRRPQPDYSVGFSENAFTEEQLSKLRLYIGHCSPKFQSYFMATWQIFFPFLACEVKCGTSSVLPAERQNAHSMTLAVRGTVELFRLVGREQELHRRIVAFSVSHDHRFVSIHGHYAEINGLETKFYRHTIKQFAFTNHDDRWTTYRFTRNIYSEWMPQHFKNLCSAIDLLPIEPDLGSPSQSSLRDEISSPTYQSTVDSQGDGLPIDNSPNAHSRARKRKRRK